MFRLSGKLIQMIDDSLHEKVDETFLENQENFITKVFFESKYLNYFGFIHHKPYFMNPKEESECKLFYETLCEGIEVLVNNFETEAVIETLQPDQRTLEIIRMFSNKPYRLGTLRPDVLFDDDTFKICEINARFALNGFLISNLTEKIFGQNNYDLQEILRQRMPSSAVLKDREPDWDMGIYKELFNPVLLKPNETANIDSVMIELHQEELKELDDEYLDWLSDKYLLNDPRTIMIAHDKRLLGLLQNISLMSGYLDKRKAELLNKHIIPTYKLKDHLNAVLKNKNDWVIKPALKGKSEGLIIGKNHKKRIWKEKIEEATKGFFVCQPYFSQRRHNLDIGTGVVRTESIGMLMGIDGKYLGSGICRTRVGKNQGYLNDNHAFIPLVHPKAN